MAWKRQPLHRHCVWLSHLAADGGRKGEFIGATWAEVDWERAQWLIPTARLKAGKPHAIYLSEQALDLLTTLQTCFPSSRFVHPGHPAHLYQAATLMAYLRPHRRAVDARHRHHSRNKGGPP